MKKRPNKLPPGLHAALSQNPAACRLFPPCRRTSANRSLISSVSVSTPRGWRLWSPAATTPLS